MSLSQCFIYQQYKQRQKQMKIKIKTLRGDHFNILVQSQWCFLDVKKNIEKIRHIPVDKQKLIYKNKQPQDSAILYEIGVKDEDNMVLMKLLPKPIKVKKQKSTVEESKQVQKKKQKEKGQIDEKKVQKLVKLGYQRKDAEQSLKRNNNSFQKSVDQLSYKKKQSGNEISINEILKQQIIKNLDANQNFLQINDDCQIKFTGDLQSIAGLLRQDNQRLQKMILENPNALQELLQGYEEIQQADQGDNQGQQQQYVTDVTFTQIEQQAIQRLIDLGFKRQQVIPAYLACEKNEEMTANMLFTQKQNGDFDIEN